MKILFVSNQASRTGAPLLLLWLMRWLSEHTDHELRVALMSEGPLEMEFSRFSKTHTLRGVPLFRPLRERLYDRLTGNSRKSPASFLPEIVDAFEPDIVYLNTLVLGKYLTGFEARSKMKPLFISHVHELEITLNTMSSHQDVQRQLNLSSHVICCADCVRDNLLKSYNFQRHTHIQVIPEFIPYGSQVELLAEANTYADAGDLLARIQKAAREGCFIFGAAGSPITRKGFDLFPLLVRECSRHFAGQRFLAVWIGCSEELELFKFVQRDLHLLDLSSQTLLVPPVASGVSFIKELDVLTLLSREDPYPVVALEAAALGIPTICFEQSGGIPEFTDGGCGVTVDYLDLSKIAEALAHLASHPPLRAQMGNSCLEKVFRQCSIESVGPKFLEILEDAGRLPRDLSERN